MNETSLVIFLDEQKENRYRHWHKSDKGNILEFVVQYEALVLNQWYPIVRYDTAHGKPHRDLLLPDGTKTKELFPTYRAAEVLTIGQRDIIENWKSYRQRFLKEMRDE